MNLIEHIIITVKTLTTPVELRMQTVLSLLYEHLLYNVDLYSMIECRFINIKEYGCCEIDKYIIANYFK